MHRTHGILLAFTLAAASPSAAQVVTAGGHFTFTPPKPSDSSANIDHVVGRLMTFDRDGDGKVQQTELIDRMQPILAGDVDEDGALSESEIRAAAAAARTMPVHTVPFAGMYQMPQPAWFPARSHIEGLVDDLKLRDETHRQALELIAAHQERIPGVEEAALAGLIEEMRNLLTADQLSRFETLARARRVARTFSVTRNGPQGVVRTISIASADLGQAIEQLGLPPVEQRSAHEAIERYKADLDRRGLEEKAALVQAMSRILSADDVESFRASLDRQSAVQSNVFLGGDVVVRGTAGGIVGGVVGPLFTDLPAPSPKTVETAAPVPGQP